jgi:hypothetical protein
MTKYDGGYTVGWKLQLKNTTTGKQEMGRQETILPRR